jgi:hypothetical protein
VRKLTFIGVGVPKCGSRSFYKMLMTDSNICKIKGSPNKFCASYFNNDDIYKEDCTLYDKSFETLYNIKGDFSPFYIQTDLCLNRIKLYNPDIKILIVTRNPAKRIWSEYNAQIEFYRRSFQLPLKDVLLYNNTKNFKDIATSNKLRVTDLLYNTYYDFHIKRVHEIFPSENIMTLSIESVNENPQKVMNEVRKFIGAETSLKGNLEVINKSTHLIKEQEFLAAEPIIMELLRDNMENLYNMTGIDYRS